MTVTLPPKRAGILNVVQFGSNTFGKRRTITLIKHKNNDSLKELYVHTFHLNLLYIERIPIDCGESCVE